MSEVLQSVITLQNFVPWRVKPVDVVYAFCDVARFGIRELQTRSRQRSSITRRQQLMFILRELRLGTYEKIGKIVGGYDHQTVLHGIKRIRTTPTLFDEAQRFMAAIQKMLGITK